MNRKFRLKELTILERRDLFPTIPEGKVLFNTINAHSYNQARRDEAFAIALSDCDVLLPDGTSIVVACKFLRAKSRPKHRCTGWDLFRFEMEKLNKNGQHRNPDRIKPRVVFVGSSDRILELIREKASVEFPNLEIITYSPPFKPEFTKEDNDKMIAVINDADPDVVWIGMTAPKQEKWAYSHWNELDIHCHVGSIGAVFDFYAGTIRRAPLCMQRIGLEWLYRWSREPRRLFRRYGIGNPVFIWNMFLEALGL